MKEYLEVLAQTSRLVAINKPPGMLVHPSPIAKDVSVTALSVLRDQIGQWVYPVHRLDRKTSGVLLFALDKDTQANFNEQFKKRDANKTYHAIVRGYLSESGRLDYAIRDESGKRHEAITAYQPMEHSEIDLPFGKHTTSRYSLVELKPHTGRYHQLRMHMAHLRHPIIGDRPHGCNKQNRMFKEKFGLLEMLLHASRLEIKDPESSELHVFQAKPFPEFNRILDSLGFTKRWPFR